MFARRLTSFSSRRLRPASCPKLRRHLVVAAVQLDVCDEPRDNLLRAREQIAKAASVGAEVVALPECFTGTYGVEHFAKWQEPLSPSSLQGGAEMMAEAARGHGIFVTGGVIERESGEDKRLFNSMPVFGPDGTLMCVYRKIHLSRVLGITSEGDILSAGDKCATFDVHVKNHGVQDVAPLSLNASMKFGMACCFDLRFPAFLSRYATAANNRKRCDVVIAPSAFLRVTGVDHWDLLVRRTALDGQCYVVAPNVASRPEGVLHGHSCIADPWGNIVAQCQSEGDGFVVAEVQQSFLEHVRAKLPLTACARDNVTE